MTAAKTPLRFFIAVNFDLLCKMCPNWEHMFTKEGKDTVLPEAVELMQKADGTFELKVYE